MELKIYIPASQSLKAKRRLVKSLIERLRARFNLAINEVAELDSWQLATIGLALVGNDKNNLQTVINKINDFIQAEQGDFVILDLQHKMQIFN